MLPRSLAILFVSIVIGMIMTQQRNASIQRQLDARKKAASSPIGQSALPPLAQPAPIGQGGTQGQNSNLPLKQTELEKYQKVSTGMSYDEVRRIMGPGVEIDRIERPGGPETDQVTYRWPTASGAEIHMTFSSDRLTSQTIKK